LLEHIWHIWPRYLQCVAGLAAVSVLLCCPLLQQIKYLASALSCSALRGWLLSAYDVRACAIEVVWRWLGLVQPPGLPHQQQLQAMEALTIYCPLGHALGLGGCSAALEDAAFKVGGFGRVVWGPVFGVPVWCTFAHCAVFVAGHCVPAG
jgi:hypothetical protein